MASSPVTFSDSFQVKLKIRSFADSVSLTSFRRSKNCISFPIVLYHHLQNCLRTLFSFIHGRETAILRNGNISHWAQTHRNLSLGGMSHAVLSIFSLNRWGSWGPQQLHDLFQLLVRELEPESGLKSGMCSFHSFQNPSALPKSYILFALIEWLLNSFLSQFSCVTATLDS